MATTYHRSRQSPPHETGPGSWRVTCSCPCGWTADAHGFSEAAAQRTARRLGATHEAEKEAALAKADTSAPSKAKEQSRPDTRDTPRKGLGVVPIMILTLVATMIFFGLVTLITGGDSHPWDTCEGYRADVSEGSAQDVMDIRNGNNPCN